MLVSYWCGRWQSPPLHKSTSSFYDQEIINIFLKMNTLHRKYSSVKEVMVCNFAIENRTCGCASARSFMYLFSPWASHPNCEWQPDLHLSQSSARRSGGTDLTTQSKGPPHHSGSWLMISRSACYGLKQKARRKKRSSELHEEVMDEEDPHTPFQNHQMPPLILKPPTVIQSA